MTSIFQVSHILQFILRAFTVALLISYMTYFFFPLSFPVSKCNIQSAIWQMLYCFLPIRLQVLLRTHDKHNQMHHKGFL